jgi:hypothetical protein
MSRENQNNNDDMSLASSRYTRKVAPGKAAVKDWVETPTLASAPSDFSSLDTTFLAFAGFLPLAGGSSSSGARFAAVDGGDGSATADLRRVDRRRSCWGTSAAFLLGMMGGVG